MVRIKHDIDLLTYRESQLYLDNTITGGSNVFNLAYDFTGSAANPPNLVTSLSFLGGDTVYVVKVEIMLTLAASGSFHNAGYGSLSTEIGGFGMFYKTTANGEEIPIANDGNSTNQLPAKKITGNRGLFRVCDEYQLFDPGSNRQSIKFTKHHDPPLKITSSGGYFLRFSKENLAANNVDEFYCTVYYWS